MGREIDSDAADEKLRDPEDIEDPDPPDVDTHEVEKPVGTLTVRADPETGRVAWTADDRSGNRAKLDGDRRAVLFSPPTNLFGERRDGIGLDDATFEKLEADLAAVEEYREAARAAKEKRREIERERQDALERDRELELELDEIEYTVGSRTKYHRTARVLRPNNQRRNQTESERETMDALRRLLGDRDGDILADEDGPFDEADVGDTWTLDEAAARVDGVDDEIEAVRADREAEQAREEMLERFPRLRRTGADPETVMEGAEQAAEEDTDVVVAHGGGECSDPSLECSWDNISYIVTPEGEIETSRTHTY